jgi:predicted PurR-regulated permease PerM
LGAALMLVGVLSVCGALTYTLQGQALTVIDQLPAGARKLAASLRNPPGGEPGAVEKVQQAADALQGANKAPAPAGVTRVQIEDRWFQASTFVWSTSLGLISAANQVVIVLFLTYFMLLLDELFKRKLVEMVGPFSQKKVTITVLDDIARQIQRFIVIQIFTCALVAVVTAVALRLVGLNQAAFWGLLAGILNSIPYYGPLLVTAALSIVGFVQFGTIGMAAAVAGVSLLVTALEGWLLTPTLMGRASSMNQVAVFTGLLFWSWVWGVWGILLAVPNDDGHQSRLRPCRAAAASRTPPRRLILVTRAGLMMLTTSYGAAGCGMSKKSAPNASRAATRPTPSDTSNTITTASTCMVHVTRHVADRQGSSRGRARWRSQAAHEQTHQWCRCRRRREAMQSTE